MFFVSERPIYACNIKILYNLIFQTLNELLEGANIPLEILDGYIDTIAISVPWSSLMQENCELEIKGLEIVVGVKKDIDFGQLARLGFSFATLDTSVNTRDIIFS